MLEKTDLSLTLDKKVYKSELKALKSRLEELQLKIIDMKIPVLIAFGGWSASGKGTSIGQLVLPLDPRCFNVYTMSPSHDDLYHPFLWSFWNKTPEKGRIAIFDRIWTRLALPEDDHGIKLTDKERDGFYYDVNSFEKQLTDDGCLLLKFFMHISKDEQKRRFKDLIKNSDTAWRINAEDLEQNKQYDKYIKYFNEMINETSKPGCEWSIIEADDIRYAVVKIYRIVVSSIEAEIERRLNPPALPQKPEPKSKTKPILSLVDLSKTIDEDEYDKKLDIYQNKISELGYKLYAKRRSVVIVYEGSDAAGKGGNIKRVTAKLDPRGYEVVPVAAPTLEEKNHHFLWRFNKKMPKDGHITIFDRSWYGRVLVERIEGFCTREEWMRAYKEINDMEQHLSNNGTIIFKFWLQIDKDEQLKRFKLRQENPLKQHKINDEDWRNREKWDMYDLSADDMFAKTSTPYAPWTIVESNDKKFARIKTLEIITSELERRL